MADFLPAIERTLKFEGGIADDPKDRGGLTNFGLSSRTYPALDIRALTVEKAKDIYLRDWWTPWPYDKIKSQDVANSVFDLAINTGKRRAFMLLQKALNVVLENAVHTEVDGVMGPHTVIAVNSCEPTELLAALRKQATLYYQSIALANPSQEKFLAGWLKRVNA